MTHKLGPREDQREACNLQRACKADRASLPLERLERDPGKDFPVLGRREKASHKDASQIKASAGGEAAQVLCSGRVEDKRCP